MDLPLPPERPTKPPSTTTKHSPPSNRLATSALYPSLLSQLGSLNNHQNKSENDKTIPPGLAQLSHRHGLQCRHIRRPTLGKDYLRGKRYYSDVDKCDRFPITQEILVRISNNCPIHMMEPTAKRYYVLDSQHFYEQANLPMINGKNLHQAFLSHGHPSLSKMAISSSLSLPPKQTTFTRVSGSHSPLPHLGPRHAL